MFFFKNILNDIAMLLYKSKMIYNLHEKNVLN